MWNELLEHFQTLEQRPLERMAILVGGLLIFWIIEGAIPLFPLKYKKTKLRHAGVNFVFTVIHLIIHTFLAILIVKLSDWCLQNSFGIVYWTNANSDTNVDVTTGLRHHPGDSLLRGIFFLLLIFISGAPMYSVMIYQTLVVIATAFTHANISLPVSVDKALSFILISPNMHKIHHHWKQPYTDSNYGAVFSIWDRLLGTFKSLDIKQVRYGLDRYYPEDKDEDVLMLLKKPFEKLEK